jgi:hypothetical protein
MTPARAISGRVGPRNDIASIGTAFIPRGVAHAWKNTSTETGRALFMYTPAQAGKLFEDSRLLQRPLSLMSEHEITELFQIHRWEIVGPSPF